MAIHCKGACYKTKRPQRRPFDTHRHCRTCDFWVLIGKGIGKNGSRCSCCNGIMAYLPRLNQKKRAYREVMSTINYKKINVPVEQNPFPDEKVEKW